MLSMPFDSQISSYDEQGYPIYDRASNASELASLFQKYFTNGVFANPSTSLQVSSSTDSSMTVVVSPGSGNINGYFCKEDTDRTMIVQASDTTYDRIDSVVLRLNLNVAVRSIDLYVVKGTPATTPRAPELTRNSSIFELCLANLFIAKNTTSISASRITDTRLDTEVCGIVQQTIQTIDTSSIFAQYQSALDDYLDIVRGALDETLAGNLQNQIDTINLNIGNLEDLPTTDKSSVIGSITELNTNLGSNLKIETGTVQFKNVSAEATTYIPITLTKFSQPPKVFVNINTVVPDKRNVSAYVNSNTSASIYISVKESVLATATVDWVAIGV